jgi:hypothetical protein
MNCTASLTLSSGFIAPLITLSNVHRLSDIKTQSVPKDPSAASVYFVKILIDCLCVGPATEKELRNAVIEKCKVSGVKATTRGTVSGKRWWLC